MIASNAVLLRLQLNASRRWRRRPCYEAVVETARSRQLAGASVFLVDMSYGTHQTLRDATSEYLAVDVPITVEVVDTADRIDGLLTELAEMESDGLATIEPVLVVSWAHDTEKASPRASVPAPANAAASGPGMPSDRPLDSPSGVPFMRLEGQAQRVTVYVSHTDKWKGHHLATAIIQQCQQMGMAGATASLGVLGFGKRAAIHRTHLFGGSEDVPEKIEIVDRPERIAVLLPVLEEMAQGGLILVQDVQVVRPAHDRSST